MEKYQDLIITLIKNHRRYPGCEQILDKIVEEVCNKASSVIESVTDENIVQKYLIKTVSTAMIIVPKRYNIDYHLKPKTVPTFNTLDTQDELPTTNELVKSSENIEDNPRTEDVGLNTEIIDTDNDLNLVTDKACDIAIIDDSEQSDTELIIDEDSADGSIAVENEVVENLSENNEQEEILSDEPTRDDLYDKTLVDKMINGVPTEEAQTELIELSEDGLNVDNLNEDIENPILQEIEEIDEDISDLIFDTEDENIDKEVSDEDYNSDNSSLTTDENDIFDINDDALNNDCATENEPFSLPDFSCFRFKTENKITDTEDIISDINHLAERHPNKHIKEIWELKYIKGASIEEIAAQLNIEVNEVLETISDLIDIVEV